MNRGRGLTSIRSSCSGPGIPGRDEEITLRAILTLLLQEVRIFIDQTTATTDSTWDEAGNMLTKTNPFGTTTYAWKYNNRLLSVTDPNNQITTYGYSSRELDPNGLMYYRSRYYSTDTGRFLNQDYYQGDALVPPSLHRYTYTHNNPVDYVDQMDLAKMPPLGLTFTLASANKEVNIGKTFVLQ